MKLLAIAALFLTSSCIIVETAADVVVGTVDVTTDVIGGGYDLVAGGDEESEKAAEAEPEYEYRESSEGY